MIGVIVYWGSILKSPYLWNLASGQTPLSPGQPPQSTREREGSPQDEPRAQKRVSGLGFRVLGF